MVKISNQFGDVKRGVQGEAVYQRVYGQQVRRQHREHKNANTKGQKLQRDRFKAGIDWWKTLSVEERRFLKSYMAAHGIGDVEGQPPTAYNFAKSIAMSVPRVEMETGETGGVFPEPYENWSFRRAITLTNAGSQLSSHQVLVTLTPGTFNYAHCNENGSDIRFSASDKVTPQPYYVESWSYNGTSKIWVLADSIPSGTNVCLYLYHGNEAAEDESDGEAVFLFFDDFNDGSIDTDKWNIGGAPTEAGGEVHIDADNEYIKSKTTWDRDVAVRFRAKIEDDATNVPTPRVGFYNYPGGSITTGVIVIANKHTVGQVTFRTDGTTTNVTNINEYHVFDLSWITNKAKCYVDDVLKATHTSNVPTGAYPVELFGYKEAAGADPDIWGDFILVRKYVDPEPAVTEIGTEEIGQGEVVLTGLEIYHPAIKSFEVVGAGMKEDGLSNLTDRISTFVTRANLNLVATEIKVTTLADQEYTFPVK